MASRRSAASSRRYDHTHVERTSIMREIDAELSHPGIVMLCAPWGYGRSTLMRDYVRLVHRRTPGRPLVTVNLSEGPRKSADASARARGPYGSHVLRWAFSQVSQEAPEWAERVVRGGGSADPIGEGAPLVAIDDQPCLGEAAQLEFSLALREWVRLGARVLICCTPASRIPHDLLPEAFVLSAAMLSVSSSELSLWMRNLQLGGLGSITAATMGVPSLVDACRCVGVEDVAEDEAFLRVSERVLEHALDDDAQPQVRRACWAMAMLGQGRLDDLQAVGVATCGNDVRGLVETYPLFGVDVARGTFSCIPVTCGRAGALMARVVGSDEALARRCVQLLVAHGNIRRAGDLAAFLSDGTRLALYGCDPDVFADAGNDGSIGRCLHLRGLSPTVGQPVRTGLARLVCLHAVAHDTPSRLVDEEAQRLTAGSSEGALRAARLVLGFWRGLGAGGPIERDADDGGAAPADAGEGVTRHAVPADFGAFALADDMGSIVYAMGAAALETDAAAYQEQVVRMCRAVCLPSGGLHVAIYACHMALCGFLCDRAETVLSWMEPLVASLPCRTAPRRPATVSEALVSGVCATARLLVERPSALSVGRESASALREARAFFSERANGPGIAFVSLLEAACLVAIGAERQAQDLLASCLARWSVQGMRSGQLVANLGLALCDLVQGSVNQAGVHAQTAERLARHMGALGALRCVRLLQSMVTVRNGQGMECDRRLLEATLHRSGAYPQRQAALEVEFALLSAQSGDGVGAREALGGLLADGRPVSFRACVAAARCLGPQRTAFLEVMPHALLEEYESLGQVEQRPAGREGSGGLVVASTGHPKGKGLALVLFGGLRATVNGHLIHDQDWGRRKARLLLALMALFPDTPISREMLISVVWPEGSTVYVRNNLNSVLSSLRATLGQKDGGRRYVITAGDAVMLNPELVDVDVKRFEACARSVLARRIGASQVEVIDACSRVEQIYRFGFGNEFVGAPYFVKTRMEELSQLFIDCMVLGSRLSLEVDDTQLAVWFARAAERAGSGVFDVQRALRDALAAQKRKQGVVAEQPEQLGQARIPQRVEEAAWG